MQKYFVVVQLGEKESGQDLKIEPLTVAALDAKTASHVSLLLQFYISALLK